MVKAKKDDKPQPPKRALSSFFLYRKEQYPIVHGERPELKTPDITKIISAKWGVLPELQKQKYVEEYQKNKIEADKEKAEYESKYGKIVRKLKKKKNKAKDAKKAKGDDQSEDEDEEDDQ